MPMRGSLASTDLTIDATLTSAASAFAWRESSGTSVVFAVCGFDAIQRIESNWQGKFWYSAVPSLATHLNISAEAKGAAQNAGSINATSVRLIGNGWRTWFPPSNAIISTLAPARSINHKKRRQKKSPLLFGRGAGMRELRYGTTAALAWLIANAASCGSSSR